MYVQTREELEQPSRVRQFVAEVVAAEPRPERFKGFLELKDVPLDVQIDDVRCILLKTTPVRAPNPGLSPRELEIARMVAKGLPNKSIASVLQISTWTVSSHLRRVFGKLGVTSRTEMLGRLLEEDVFQPTDHQ